MVNKEQKIIKKSINHPFSSNKQYPTKLLNTAIPRVFGYFPNIIQTCMYLSTDLLTHCEFFLLPGKHFEPSDLHAGDEVYYILYGDIITHQPKSGQTISVKKGQVLYIPKGTPHTAYNFKNKKAQILTFFSPRIWATDEDKLSLKKEHPGKVVTPGFGGWEGEIKISNYKLIENLNKIGCFPADGKMSRKNGLLFKVTSENALSFIHGKQNQILLQIFVSNDLITVGTVAIPSNISSDFEKHEGEEVLHVLSGSLSIIMDENCNNIISNPRIELKTGDKFFIPKRTCHRYVNLDTKPVKFVFAIAPQYGLGENL